MRVIIAGTRTFEDREKIFAVLDYLHSLYGFTAVISGLARGPDTIGKEWAEERGIPVECCAADWKKYGNAAGIIRNSQMANEAGPSGRLVAFHDNVSTGTADMIRKMDGRVLHIYNIEETGPLDL